MTIWKKKRQASGLSKMDMADELGLNYGKYIAIEKGDIKMPSKLIDKFNEIINRGNENKIKSIENNIKADEFWNEVKQKRENGTYVLIGKMEEFNIPNMPTLCKLLDYKSTGTIYNYLVGRNEPSDEFKKRLYTFFNDETNIQIPTKKKEIIKNIKENKMDKDLDDFYNSDLKKLLKENKITCVEIANYIGVHNSTICNLVNKKYKPGYDIISKTKEYIDSRINGTIIAKRDVKPQIDVWFEEPMKMEDLVVDGNEKVEEEKTKESVIARYTKELDEINELIEFYNNKIKDLEIRKKVCVEVLNVIDELKNVGE